MKHAELSSLADMLVTMGENLAPGACVTVLIQSTTDEDPENQDAFLCSNIDTTESLASCLKEAAANAGFGGTETLGNG